MKWRQLLWIAFCVVTLWGRAAGSPTDAPASTASASPAGTISTTTSTTSSTSTSSSTTTSSSSNSTSSSSTTSSSSGTATEPPSAAKPAREATAGPPAAALTTSAVPGAARTSPPPGRTPTSSEARAATGSPTAWTPSPTAARTSPPGVPRQTAAPAPGGRASNSSKSITCHEVKDVRDTGAICLHLKEASSCKHFLEQKGSDLWTAICEESVHHVPSPCQIKLAKSEVDRNCMLLILVGEREPATDMLQESHWEKFGIKSLKRGSVRSHQDYSRKTLIALVTAGLLLALLGLAGYFLMRRRSWSPAGERLNLRTGLYVCLVQLL
ncbi:hematopoietic progenitor cell antigen CD34 isoform X2 [Rhea pennata]|uniref:hematopoietic progenitor cell antigen CD34 isoform X2 n=1 Tax=Rhea pennata TaxID=8795 RepID=UPI002E26C78E